jgi:hypothetical protein
MAKISDYERDKYHEKVRPYKAAIKAILDREQSELLLIKREPETAAVKRLNLVEEMLNATSNYIIISGVSMAVLKVKNEDALNDARKALYKSVIYLGDVVSNFIDAPFADYEEKLAEIESLDAQQRYLLARKMGLAIELLENAYGDNTKWKWSFVELESRYATVVKNLLNLRSAVANTDPRSPNYEPTVLHLRLIKKLLMQSADRYREKYELSTSRIDDFKQGIVFLSALRRLHVMMGDRDDAEIIKKKLDIWTVKLDSDIRKKEEQGLKKA